MAKEISHLHVKLSTKLKTDFQAVCDELEIDMSDKVRELIANMVRNHKRQGAKAGKESE